MIVGNVPMIKPIVSRYGKRWMPSKSTSRNKSSGVSGSLEMGNRNQNHHPNDSERQICDDSDSMEHIVGKAEGLEITTNKTYEVTYENSDTEQAALKERIHTLNMGYTARTHVAAGTNNV